MAKPDHFSFRGEISIREKSYEASELLIDEDQSVLALFEDAAPEVRRVESDDHGYPRAFYGRYLITFERLD